MTFTGLLAVELLVVIAILLVATILVQTGAISMAVLAWFA